MFIHRDNLIHIENITLTVDEFKKLEPSYEGLPSGYTCRLFVPGKIHEMTGPGQSTITGDVNWSDGRRYIRRKQDFLNYKKTVETAELERHKLVEIEIKKREPYNESRIAEYPNLNNMVVSLWEKIVEHKSDEESGILDIQEKREKIKKKYPKKK